MSTVAEQQAANDAAAAAVAAVVSPAEAEALAAEVEVDSSWLDAKVRLDTALPYALVMDGSGTSKTRFWQAGQNFDHAGELIKE